MIIPDRATWERLAYTDSDRTSSHGVSVVKFQFLNIDGERPALYFQNTRRIWRHLDFRQAVGIQDIGITGNIYYFPNLVAPDGTNGVYRFNLTHSTYAGSEKFERRALIYTLLAASMPLLDDDLAVRMPNQELLELQPHLPLYRESRLNLVFDEDVLAGANFVASNPAVGYGILRSRDPDDMPGQREIVIYETLPNELPRVAGVVSTVPQTPLSHVNLRAAQNGIPNAFIRDALTDPTIEPLLNGYVRYTVTEVGWDMRAATLEEVNAHYASSRPAAAQTPERDLTVTAITPLSEIGFDDWDAFGVKAANLAVLRTLGLPAGTVPDGYAIPFYFYDEFMKANDFYSRIDTMLADTSFQSDLAVQDTMLDDLRDDIKDATTPQFIIDALASMHAAYPENQSLRYRSSTNNEDLPNFNGAGLYDSKTQKPKETTKDGIDKSLKQVYASMWTLRAFSEREFHRIDHKAAAMGVLVHPNYTDEKVNGVAVSTDPAYGTTGTYYINSQLGEDLVTNPDEHSVPEEILLGQNDARTIVRLSNQVPAGQLLMSEAQLTQLRSHLARIHSRFAQLYRPAADEPFAIEIEFKITSDNVLAIKQARPWIFPTAPTDTVTVAAETGTPLTASFDTPPAIHHGYPFEVRIRFSEFVRVSVTQRLGRSLTVTGGTIERVYRLSRDLDRYAIRIVPGREVVTIELAVTNLPCDQPELGAICTLDGRRLTTPLSHTVGNQGPEISPRPESFAVEENSTMVATFGATDPEGDAVFWSLSGGDAAVFEISETGGVLAFRSAPDFETPRDSGRDNVYSVVVQASDRKRFSGFADSAVDDTLAVSVTVTDVDEVPNSVAAGAPTIGGTAVVGETLTASVTAITDTDGLQNVAFAYQWLADDTDIAGADASSYTLTASEVGKAIKVRVSFRDDADNAETLTSAATAAVTPAAVAVNSAAAGAPTIGGTAVVGETLTASVAAITDADGLQNVVFVYQWLADDTDVVGADASSYTLTSSEVGRAIKVRVSFRDDADNAETLTSTATAAVKAQLSATIRGAPGSHDGTDFTFELRFSEAFYVSYKTLRDHAFTVAGGEVVNARRLVRGKSRIWEITVRPSSGAAVTVELPATTDCTAAGAVCTPDQRMLTAVAALVVPGPSQPAPQNSVAAGEPAIGGTAVAGETLTASVAAITDADGLQNVVFVYQWLADDTDIAGADASSYTLTSSEVGKAIKVRVSFRDDADNAETLTSTATTAVKPREMAGTLLAGSMRWGAGSSQGMDYTGFAGAGAVGGFEARYWDGRSVAHERALYSLAQIHGEVGTGPAAGLSDPVVMTVLPSVDLSGGFWLQVGDLLLASGDAVTRTSPTGMQSWMWDAPCVRWVDGDRAEMRIVASGSSDVFSGAYSDASLGSLSLEGAVLEGVFDPSTRDYAAVAAAGVGAVTVDATAQSAHACGVVIEPADSDPGVAGHQVELGDEGVVVSVTVTAADGQTTGVYSVAVGREAP